MMRESTRNQVKVGANWDMAWTLCGGDEFLRWLNIDPNRTRPTNMFVHLVQYKTRAREEMKLRRKINMARKDDSCPSDVVDDLKGKLSDLQSSRTASEGLPHQIDKNYHWSGYDECVVTYKKRQTQKVVNELQLVVKVRTLYLGFGNPKDNNGYCEGGRSPEFLDPLSPLYKLLHNLDM